MWLQFEHKWIETCHTKENKTHSSYSTSSA